MTSAAIPAGPVPHDLRNMDIPDLAGEGVRRRFAQHGPAYKWMLLGAMLSGSMATLLAATTINVALPAIIGAFGLGQDQAQWMSTAFLAASTIAMLSNAWAMKRFGPRLTYMIGMVLFLAGSMLGFIATNYSLLILSRAMQGIAAGLLQPMSMFLIFQTFQDSRRGTAMGIFSIGVVLAPAFGPALGGIAVDLSSWRLVFIATLPLAVVAMVFAAALMPMRDEGEDVERPPLDWVGLILIGLCVVTLLAGIAGGDRDGWHSDKTVLRFSICLLSGASFFFWELRHPFPALNLNVFRHWQFASAGVVIITTGMAIYGSTYLIPIFVQVIQGYSPTAAGVMMIPAGIAMVIGFPIAGRLTDRVDVRWLFAFGAICFALSMWLLAGVSVSTPYWSLIGWIILSRIGISFLMPPANTTAVRGVPPTILASATGAASFLMQVGGATGVTLLAVFLQRRTIFHGDHLASALHEGNSELMYMHQLNTMRLQTDGMPLREAFMHGFDPIGRSVAREAFMFGFRDSFLVVAIGFAIVLTFIAFLPKPRLAVRPPR